MLNEIHLTGRLCADPELHYVEDVPVCNFRIAVENDRKDKAAGRRKADFFNVSVWRVSGEYFAQRLAKGSIVTVVGRVKFKEYTAKDGSKRMSASVVAEKVYPLYLERRRTLETDGI